jgi:hypothetical protein
MAIVKLNKLQRISENMSQLLSNETHMPKNLYQNTATGAGAPPRPLQISANQNNSFSVDH